MWKIHTNIWKMIDKRAYVWYNNILPHFMQKEVALLPDHDSKKRSDRRVLDDFWDIESLLPDRPARRVSDKPRTTPTAVEVELPPPPDRAPAEGAAGSQPVQAAKLTGAAPDASAEKQDRVSDAAAPASTVRYVPPHAGSNAEEEPLLLDYKPDGVLLHRVKVFGWRANYHYFDQFSKDALHYDALKPPETARPESFFSYFPQYVQMNRRQTAWYLWWRERVREGQYPDTDYAYILLYLFELINLPAEGPAIARLHRDRMAGVWMAYRRTFPQLDHYMCEWLCDYCLIHRQTAPVDLLAPALDDIIVGSRLKEFYLFALVGGEGRDMETARILLRHCCQYDYRKSKFAQGEHRALFDQIIPAAVAAVLPLILGRDDRKPAITMLESTVTRDAYTGALCSYRNKRRIEVAYTSFSRSHELRFLIGDMVKHIENRLRGWIGVRSRLSVLSLPIPLRDALDAYLIPLAPAKSVTPPKAKDRSRPAYEALYDQPSKPLSVADAAAIEATSWETTRLLTEAFSDADADEPAASRAPTVPDTAPRPVPESSTVAQSEEIPSIAPPVSTDDSLREALGEWIPFVRAALESDREAQRAFAAAVHKMPDAIADAINHITAETVIFDIILEDDGTGLYTVLEDYRADVAAEIL